MRWRREGGEETAGACLVGDGGHGEKKDFLRDEDET